MTPEYKAEIIVTTKRPWLLLDPSGPEFESFFELPPGSHRVEIAPSPYGRDETWLVLEGTPIGKPVKSWLVFQNRVDEFQVRIEGNMLPQTR